MQVQGAADAPRRFRSTSVQLGAVAALALTFASGCGSGGDRDAENLRAGEHDRVCVDDSDTVRDDDDCEDNHRHHWYYYPSGQRRPGYGSKASGIPHASRYPTGVKQDDGAYSAPTVRRGGFGSSRTSGGGS